MKMSLMTAERPDADLAREAASGDRDAFAALVRRHGAALYAFCRRIVRDAAEAEDRVQEAFVKAYRSLGAFDPACRFEGWLYRIAQNACIDALRRREPTEPLPPDPVAAPLSEVDAGRLEEAIGELSAKQKVILHHKYRRGLNAAEIAAEMGLTHEDVRVCLHRAIRRLRERLSR